MSTEAKIIHNLTNPPAHPGDDVLPSRKQRVTGSTHFGDGEPHSQYYAKNCFFDLRTL